MVVFADRTSKNLQLKLSSPSTIIAYGVPAHRSNQTMFVKSGYVSSYVDYKIESNKQGYGTSLEKDVVFSPTGGTPSVDLSIDETAQNITINGDYSSIFLIVKPRGKNCALQGWVLSFAKPNSPKSIELTDVVGGTVSKESRVVAGQSQYIDELKGNRSAFQYVPEEGVDASKVVINPTETLVSVLKVKAGTAASANINWNGLPPLKTSGLVNITDTGVTVSANATSADSVRSQYLDVVIED